MFSTNAFTLLLLALSPVTTLAAPPPRPHSKITSYALPGNNSYPEGVARQPNSPYFYAGSVTTGSIYRGSVYNPQMEVWVPTTPSPALAGIKIDYQDRLYISGYTSGSLFVYDIPTRELIYTFTAPYNGSGLNDLAIADDGTVYITDSSQPYLLYITPDQLAAKETEQELKIYKDISADIPYIYGPGVPVANGIVVTEDQEFLIVGSWGGRAIYRVCLETKEVSLIDLGGKTIGKVDGLLLQGETIYSVNSGYELGLFIDVLTIEYPYLEANPVGDLTSDLLHGPSTAAFDGDDMLVANFQNGIPNLHLPFDIVRIPLYQKE